MAAVEVAFLSVHELVGLCFGKHHFSFGFKSYGNILSPFHGGDSGDTVTLATRTSPRFWHLLSVALGGGYYWAEISVPSLACVRFESFGNDTSECSSASHCVLLETGATSGQDVPNAVLPTGGRRAVPICWTCSGRWPGGPGCPELGVAPATVSVV